VDRVLEDGNVKEGREQVEEGRRKG